MDHPLQESRYLLLVEPNADVRIALVDFLEAEGYRVKVAGTGAEAIYALEEGLPYVVALLDIDLPDMEGINLLKALGRFDPHLPVIVITGLTELDQAIRTFRHGALAFLRKPYNREEVLALVSRAANIRAMAQTAQTFEATLESTEGRFQLIIQAVKDGIILADEQGRVIEWNEAAERIFGYLAEEIKGCPLTAIMPARFREAHLRGLEQYRTTGKGKLLGKTLEVQGQKKDGSEIPIELSVSTWHQKGHMVFCGVVRDIGERVKNEQKILERERLSQLKYEVSQVLAEGQDLSQVLQSCAERLVDQLGMTFARIWVLDGPSQILHLQASAGLYTHLNGSHARIAVGQYKIGRIALTRKPHLTNHVQEDPEVHDQEWARREGLVAFAGYPMVVKGQLVGVLGMFAGHRLTEVTLKALASIANGIGLAISHKQAEEQVHRLQELEERILDSIQEGVYGLDRQGRTIFMNSAATRMLGWTPDELMGQVLHRLIHHTKQNGAPYSQEECPISSSYRDGALRVVTREVFWRKDGTELSVEYASNPLRTSEGELVGAVVVFKKASSSA